MPGLLLRRPPSWVVALAVVALVDAAVIAALGLGRLPVADGVGLVLAGLPPLLIGAMVCRSGWARAHGDREPFRVLLGLAGVCWGAGQVWLGVRAARDGFAVDALPVPAAGDVLAAVAAPLAVWGLAVLPRPGAQPLERLRKATDAVLIALTASMVLWELFFRASFGGALATANLAVAAFVVLDLLVLAIFVVTAAREADLGLWLAAVGVAAQVGTDLVGLHGAAGGRPWQGAAVTCLAWTLVGVGVALVRPTAVRARREFRPAVESRRLVAVSGLFLGLAVVLLLGLLRPSAAAVVLGDQQVVFALGVCFLVVLWGREVIRARQSQDLLERLGEQALTDPLTGLGNRRGLGDSLARHELAEVGLVTFDLDGFKDVNRLLGHAGGDALLVRVARLVLAELDPRGAWAFRLGGDEFAVLVVGPQARALAVADRLLVAMRSVGGDLPGLGRVALSASFGVVHHVGTVGAPVRTALLDLSGEAMRESKATGRNQVTLYSDATAARARRRSAVERRLRHVVQHGGLDVHYQPVMDTCTGTVVGVEALARWCDPELGDVAPLEFIGVAEDVGLMPEVGLRILERALQGFVGSGAAARGATIGVNVSTLQLRTPGYAQVVVDRVAAAGMRPDQVVIEVTESVLLADGAVATGAVYALAAAGHPIALDDFGTGYSSLAYLHQLPVAVLKVDRSMTTSLDTPGGQAIARSIVQMAQALGLDLVAEGVETDEQARHVRELGIPYVQGWLYSRALPADALRDFVERHGTRAEHETARALAGKRTRTP